MIEKNKEVCINGEKLLLALKDIEYMLISLHAIGSHYAPDLPEKALEYRARTTQFIDDGKVTERLAQIRRTLSSAFDQTRGDDDLTDVERALDDLVFWKPL